MGVFPLKTMSEDPIWVYDIRTVVSPVVVERRRHQQDEQHCSTQPNLFVFLPGYAHTSTFKYIRFAT